MSQHCSGQIDHAGVFTCAYSLSFVNPASASVKRGTMVGLVLWFRHIRLLGNLSFFVFLFFQFQLALCHSFCQIYLEMEKFLASHKAALCPR